MNMTENVGKIIKRFKSKDEETYNNTMDDLGKLKLLLESTLQKFYESTGSVFSLKMVENIASSIDRIERQTNTTSEMVKVIVC